MKKFLLAGLLVTLNAGAATIDLGILDAKAMQIGALAQDQNQTVSDVVVFKRTASTPSKVKVTYSFNYVDRECIDFKIESKWIPEFSKTVCKKSGGGTHDCRIRDFEGYYQNERVCSNKGLELKTKNVKAVFNFKNAIPLTEGVEEIFTLSLTQKKMKSDSVKFELTSVDSSGIYKFSKLGKNFFFKLK